MFDERRYLGFSGRFPAHFVSMYSLNDHPKNLTAPGMPSTTQRRRRFGFSKTCLCEESEIAMIASDHETSEQSDGELRQRAFKRIIDICEDSISRNDVHMTIQCDKCAKCKTCRDIKRINASSYNDFVEQQVMEQLVKFVDGQNGEPGYFISPLTIKPFKINSVRENRATADEQNKKMIEKLQ